MEKSIESICPKNGLNLNGNTCNISNALLGVTHSLFAPFYLGSLLVVLVVYATMHSGPTHVGPI